MIDLGSDKFRKQLITYLIDEYGLNNSESIDELPAQTLSEVIENLNSTLYDRRSTENVEGLKYCWVTGKKLTRDALHITIPIQRLYPDIEEPKQGIIESISFYVNREDLESEINKQLVNMGLQVAA